MRHRIVNMVGQSGALYYKVESSTDGKLWRYEGIFDRTEKGLAEARQYIVDKLNEGAVVEEYEDGKMVSGPIGVMDEQDVKAGMA